MRSRALHTLTYLLLLRPPIHSCGKKTRADNRPGFLKLAVRATCLSSHKGGNARAGQGWREQEGRRGGGRRMRRMGGGSVDQTAGLTPSLLALSLPHTLFFSTLRHRETLLGGSGFEARWGVVGGPGQAEFTYLSCWIAARSQRI